MMRKYSPKPDSARKEKEMMDAFKVRSLPPLMFAFQVFDHNNDSVIDFEEIKRTMHFLGEAVTDDEVREMIREADQDQDGYISFDGNALSFSLSVLSIRCCNPRFVYLKLLCH
ncbi:hypothetical protein Ciccas_005456 [Cichlidogyrus casuarinus]|uniref:EF-hand domain-containing protein n=1 Tax=Cichlidogyrus casuarinus TaxID=1844966 RepID=A0ABD2Q8N1_9PLAT